ncbi:uncharacterized protein BHQ10_002323 [Talaromyces amestolkiae]|uniref:Carrier domain-containing protein n=1 Tax=Talaromyces amestolkiae TaxID=1196081 RepID=A0A364KS31_TALAM|nr:uncharacterized protein BHQ10_002323 [Talaromyces amestolkiae]RAO66311.1 hypothetical protein BHQ10_002323 [Talaromyces amestolkiae]
MLPMRVQVDRLQLVSHFLPYVREWSDRVISSHLDLEDIRSLNAGAEVATGFQTVIRFLEGRLEWHKQSSSPNYGDKPGRSSQYSLIIYCSRYGNALSFLAEFNQTILPTSTVRLLIDDLEHAVWQLINGRDDQALRLDSLEQLGPHARRQLLRYNRPLAPKLNSFVHDIIEQQVSELPQAAAIDAWDGQLSYSQLWERSRALAHHLQRLGVGPGVLVPLIFEKSSKSVIAILAVLQAGGATVALDPSVPVVRQHTIIRDVGAFVVITSSTHRDKVPAHITIASLKYNVVLDDDLLRQLAGVTESGLIQHTPVSTPDDPAYVIFTSGSTGKPKGVVISHSAFVSSSAGYSKAIYLTSPRSRVLQYSSFTFDACMLEILTTLTVGACICIPSEEDRLNDLAKCINSFDVNWTILTPSVASLLDPKDVPGLEVIGMVGEALPFHLADRWAGHAKTINAYGPAEASILTVISEPRIAGSGPVYLGRPPNCAVWLVDPDNFKQLVPFNTVGEIVLEGPVLATGYLNNRELTEAAFVEDPEFLRPVIGASTGGIVPRVYRTGDLGQMHADGVIEFLGRKDTQVKIRGQRIELGEIESNIKKLLSDESDDSLEIVVEVLWPDSKDRKQNQGDTGAMVLTCFACKKNTSPPDANSLALFSDHKDPGHSATEISKLMKRTMERLAGILPTYMIPKVILPCQAIPHTSSGKTDRKRLRALGAQMSTDILLTLGIPSAPSAAVSDPIEALSETERILQEIWAKLLGLPQQSIGPNDDFFKLGADSMVAIKMVAACRKAGLKITYATIFGKPGLREMAAVCERPKEATTDGLTASHQIPAPVPSQIRPFSMLKPQDILELTEEAAIQCNMSKDSIEDLYPCTYLQEGLMAVNLTRPGAYTAQMVHELPRGTDMVRFRHIWETIYAACRILRTRFVMTLAGSLQAVIKGRIQWNAADSLESYLKRDEGELMVPGVALSRFAIITGPDGHATHFVWTMHHMLYDGWTLGLLLRKANAMYRGVKFSIIDDFCHFVAYTKSLDKDSMGRYWQQELKDAPASTFPVSSRLGYQSIARTIIRDRLELSHSPPAGLTLPSLIRAAWAIMISHFSQTDDVVFGAIVSGRSTPMPNIELIVGPVIATVPVRLRVQPDQRVLDFLRHVQNHSIQMLHYEQAGIQQIRQLNSHTKRGCEFQNLLAVQFDWEEDNGLLAKPQYREEFTTYPVTCEVKVIQSRKAIEFATHVDEEVTSRLVVAQAIGQVKTILHQLVRLSAESATTLSEIKVDDELGEYDDGDKESAEESMPLSSSSLPPQLPLPVTVRACIHDLIREVVERQPNAEALYSSLLSVSYWELDDFSTKLAAHLISVGVAAGTLVPLCFEKSVWTVVAMLAVLKAGAVFVALDPSQPLTRLKSILQDTETSVLLTSKLHARVTILPVANVIVVEKTLLQRLTRPEERGISLKNRASPDDLAYLIYTSGSTGKPKGVMISHSAYVSGALDHGPRQGIRQQQSRVLQFASYSFDASLVEILTTLVHGGTVCVASDKERLEDVHGFMQRAQIDYAVLTPSVVRLLRPADLPLLRTLVLVGEAADDELVKRWLDAAVDVFNGYGPSECSIVVAVQKMAPGMNVRNIGLPVAARAWVVNPNNVDELLQDGEDGELLVEGPTLARGYLNNREATESVFIWNPAWALQEGEENSGRRMYRTGDMVRRNPDGSLYYIGRKDLQVKVNGQRIELGEIEAHLSRCSQVKNGLVLFPSSGKFAKQLTAVLELEGNNYKFSEQVVHIRNYLSTRIPPAVVPKHWLDIHSLSDGGLPLLPSGKVDRSTVVSWLTKRVSIDADLFMGTREAALERETAATTIQISENPAAELAAKVSSMLPGDRSLALQHGEGFRDAIFSQSGLDSLDMMSLIHYISGRYRVHVNMQLLMDKCTTIRKLAQLITESQSSGWEKPNDVTATATPIDIMAEINKYDARVAAVQLSSSVLSSKLSEETLINRSARHKSGSNGHSLYRGRLQQRSRNSSHGQSSTSSNGSTSSSSGFNILTGSTTDSKPAMSSLLKPDHLIVLVTGASGFIGTQIIRQLLEKPTVAQVIALVRDDEHQPARTRTIASAQKALWWTDLHAEKLEVWAGDLSKPHLGLDASRWGLLNSSDNSKRVDVIVHAGAAVNWTRSYVDLEAVNIGSSVELLQLAVTGSRPRLVYVSGGRQWKSEHECDEDVALFLANDIGYSQTKFVAEAVIRRAALRTSPDCSNISIIKPGLVIGTAQEGVANIDDYLWRLTAANIAIGAFDSAQAREWLHLSDVTTLARLVVETAIDPGLDQNPQIPVQYIRDGMTWGALWDIIRNLGYQLEAKSTAQWYAAIRADLIARREQHPLWPLFHLFGEETEDSEDTANSLVTADEVPVPPLHLRIAVVKNVEFLAQIGFLPASPQSQIHGPRSLLGQPFSRSR